MAANTDSAFIDPLRSNKAFFRFKESFGRSVEEFPVSERPFVVLAFGMSALFSYLPLEGVTKLSSREFALRQSVQNSINSLQSIGISLVEEERLGAIITYCEKNLVYAPEGEKLTAGDIRWNMLVLAKAKEELEDITAKVQYFKACTKSRATFLKIIAKLPILPSAEAEELRRIKDSVAEVIKDIESWERPLQSPSLPPPDVIGDCHLRLLEAIDEIRILEARVRK